MKNKVMKQTAVEFLVEKLKSQGLLIGEINNLVAVREAKEMFEQQIINAFNQGERYGWDTQASIENIDEMRSKIPLISLEKYLEQFKKK